METYDYFNHKVSMKQKMQSYLPSFVFFIYSLGICTMGHRLHLEREVSCDINAVYIRQSVY